MPIAWAKRTAVTKLLLAGKIKILQLKGTTKSTVKLLLGPIGMMWPPPEDCEAQRPHNMQCCLGQCPVTPSGNFVSQVRDLLWLRIFPTGESGGIWSYKWSDASNIKQDFTNLLFFFLIWWSFLTSVVSQAQRRRPCLFSDRFTSAVYFLLCWQCLVFIWDPAPRGQVSSLLGMGRSLSANLHRPEVGDAGRVPKCWPLLVSLHLQVLHQHCPPWVLSIFSCEDDSK